jgi:hypothetical protein
MSGSRRGFIFTADAIFALIMITSVALMFAIYSNQPEHSARTTLVQALAYDYVALSQTPANLTLSGFTNRTGLLIFDNAASVPRDRPLAVYAVTYQYNNSCLGQDCEAGCTLTNAQALGAGSCLAESAASSRGTIKREIWVTT